MSDTPADRDDVYANPADLRLDAMRERVSRVEAGDADRADVAEMALDVDELVSTVRLLRRDGAAMRDLVDVGHQALDALLSTRLRPSDAPEWLYDVMGELHRVGGHNETPEPSRTRELMQQVLAAYDEQQPPEWWADDAQPVVDPAAWTVCETRGCNAPAYWARPEGQATWCYPPDGFSLGVRGLSTVGQSALLAPCKHPAHC